MSAGAARRDRRRRRAGRRRRPSRRGRLEPGEERQAGSVDVVASARTRGRRAATRRGARSPAAGTGSRRSRETAIAGSELAVRPGEDRPGSPSSPASARRRARSERSRRSRRGARTIGPVAAGPARIASRTAPGCARRAGPPGRRPSVDSGSSPRGRRAGGPAASCEGQHPPNVGQPPSIDRLVVVADEEDAVRRRCEEQGQAELGPVEVLRLVDKQVGAAPPPFGAAPRARTRAAAPREPRDRRSPGRRSPRRPARRPRTSARSGRPQGRPRPRLP